MTSHERIGYVNFGVEDPHSNPHLAIFGVYWSSVSGSYN